MVREFIIEGDWGEIRIGGSNPLVVIAGPCVIEDEEQSLAVARRLEAICSRLGLPFIFKSSYDKANRSSHTSFRGPGLEPGLEVLGRIKREVGVPVLSDVHCVQELEPAAEVLDIVQIPAFLSRQTDLLASAGASGRPVNIKKGQFLSPWDMEQAAAKVAAAGEERILLTERGTCFGYNNLVVDMRALAVMNKLGWPVVFDATHSVQLPGAAGGASGGQREFVAPLVRAAVAVGVSALFMEVHPEPEQARCDGPNMLPLSEVEGLLRTAVAVDGAVRERGGGCA